MNELSRERLFSLLSESSQQVSNGEIQNAYGGFTEQVEIVSQSKNAYPKIYRMLNNARIELVFLESLYRYEQGKKCPKICLSTKSIGIC